MNNLENKFADVLNLLTPPDLLKLGLKKVGNRDCIKCLENKPIELFLPSRNTCKQCKSTYLKEYYANNKDRVCYQYKPKQKKGKLSNLK